MKVINDICEITKAVIDQITQWIEDTPGWTDYYNRKVVVPPFKTSYGVEDIILDVIDDMHDDGYPATVENLYDYIISQTIGSD